MRIVHCNRTVERRSPCLLAAICPTKGAKGTINGPSPSFPLAPPLLLPLPPQVSIPPFSHSLFQTLPPLPSPDPPPLALPRNTSRRVLKLRWPLASASSLRFDQAPLAALPSFRHLRLLPCCLSRFRLFTPSDSPIPAPFYLRSVDFNVKILV